MAHCQYADPMETEAKTRAPQNAEKFVLRLPDGMRDQIAHRAKKANRSMNAEIVAMLSQDLEGKNPTLQAFADGPLLDEVIRRYLARGVMIVISQERNEVGHE